MRTMLFFWVPLGLRMKKHWVITCKSPADTIIWSERFDYKARHLTGDLERFSSMTFREDFSSQNALNYPRWPADSHELERLFHTTSVLKFFDDSQIEDFNLQQRRTQSSPFRFHLISRNQFSEFFHLQSTPRSATPCELNTKPLNVQLWPKFQLPTF